MTPTGHHQVEVATFRTDVGYSDGRRPDQVVFSSPQEDALRRDFTINGMFFDPLKNQLHDYVGGQADLDAKILRAIGDPIVRFQEDKLRLLRAVRIATRFSLAIEPSTEHAIRAMAGTITQVSAERIAEELRQLLVHPRRAFGVNLMFELGLAEPILPEVVPMKGLPQGLPSAPTGDLWDHVMAVLAELGLNPTFPLALATLLHDVGKPRTITRAEDRYTFYHHEHVGARLANQICQRLKLSNAHRERVVWLVDRHQYLCDAPNMRTSKLKTILAHPGITELLALHRADAVASQRSVSHVEYCEALLREWSPGELDPPPLLTGHDLLKRGLKQGPEFRRYLEAVREAQLDGAISNAAQAWELIDRMRGNPSAK